MKVVIPLLLLYYPALFAAPVPQPKFPVGTWIVAFGSDHQEWVFSNDGTGSRVVNNDFRVFRWKQTEKIICEFKETEYGGLTISFEIREEGLDVRFWTWASWRPDINYLQTCKFLRKVAQ